MDAIIHLDRLRCVTPQLRKGVPDLYVWAVLLWVDDTTIMSGQLVGSSAPGHPAARLVIKTGVTAGDHAPMPSVQGRFTHRFDDDLVRRDIAIVVAMFEKRRTPHRAVRAGYDAFVSEVPAAVVEFALSHGGNAPEGEADRREVADAVRPKVEWAVRSTLSNLEKLWATVGLRRLDEEIGVNSLSASIDDGNKPFTLTFGGARKSFNSKLRGDGEVDGHEDGHYEIDGRLELRTPPDQLTPEQKFPS